MQKARAIPVKKGYVFELSSEAHGFSYGAGGIEVGEVFTQMHSGEDFTKIPEHYSAPIKFKVLSKRYIHNNWIQRRIRNVFKSFFYEFDMTCKIIEINE